MATRPVKPIHATHVIEGAVPMTGGLASPRTSLRWLKNRGPTWVTPVKQFTARFKP